MREGLRSRKVSVEVGVNTGKGREETHLDSGSGGEKVTDLLSGNSGTVRGSPDLRIQKNNDESDNERFEEGGGGDEGGSGKVGVADNERKRKRADGGEWIANGDIWERKVKDEVEEVNDKLPVCRRVLRSSVAANGGCNKAGSKDIVNQKSSDDDGFEKKLHEEREGNCDELVNNPTRKLKGKRGRPPLAKEVGSDASGLKPKRGRPCKVEKEEHGSLALDGGLRKRLKGKRGRPRKEQGGSGAALTRKRGRPLKVRNRNGAKLGRSGKVENQEHNPSESDGPLNKKLRPKRGRPVKVQESKEVLKEDDGKEGEESVEDDEYNPLESDGGLKKKFKCKHGRPAKMQESNGVLNGEVDKEGERIARNKRILEWQDGTKQSLPSYFSYHERVLIEKELNMRSSRKKRKNGADLETKESDGSAGNISQTVFAVSLENQRAIRKGNITKKDGDVKPGKRRANQSVREKIIEILLTAGWTIQRRPRAGREYLDAVYADPGGHTHWSVTKAYNSLKEHYEAGDGESKVYRADFKFIPIPEEELSKLKRVIRKKRVGKKLKLAKGNANDNGVISKKKRKKKLVGKSQRGRTKGKSLLPEHKNLAFTKRKGIPILIRDPKQQNKRNGNRPTLLVRNSMEEADSDGDGYIPYAGKRTVLAWMIDLGTVSLNDKVQYMNQRKTWVLREGRITRDGIHCDCCSETLTISEFEIHAGSELCEPLKNICLQSGTSLLQCLLDSWNKQQEPKREGFHYIDVHGEDPNDDSCGICGDGGDLICCDGCPSTFHQSCLDIQKFPSGDWLCGYCSCKFCWMAGRNECQKDDDGDDLAASKLLTCQLCEEKYHQSCSRANNVESVDSDSSFCGKKCQELFKKLKTLVGVKHDLEEGFSWTLIHRADIDSSISLCDIPEKCDVAREIECNSKLAVALSIMDECFLPIVDQRSGINLIHSIVYNCGSNFNRLNYSCFFTAILERGDEIVCAASIRIHGDLLAEMPFIGTRYMYRRQGMCRRLLSVIESVLCSLDVERLVIPAISELQETWTSVFGFRPLEVSIKQKIKNINMLVFPHIQMLQKPMFKLQTAEENMIAVEGPKSTELEEPETKEEASCKIAPQGVEMKGPVVESSLQLPDVSLNNTDGKCLAEFVMARDSLEDEIKASMVPSDSIHGLCEQTEVTIECQKACSGLTAPVLDQRAVERSSQADQLSISEKDSGSFVLPCSEAEANGSETLVLCTSTVGIQSPDCELKVENQNVADNINSYSEGSIHRAEIKSAETHEEVLCEFEVPVRNAVSHDSKTTNQISNGDMDFKHCHSEHYTDEKMREVHEVQTNHLAVVQASATLGESTECSVSQNLRTSTPEVEVIHQISIQKAEDDSKDSQTSLPAGSFQCNGPETQEVLTSAPVDSNCNPSCGAYIDSNGLCNSKEVISGSLGVVVDSVQD